MVSANGNLPYLCSSIQASESCDSHPELPQRQIAKRWYVSELFWTLTDFEYSHWLQPLIETPKDSILMSLLVTPIPRSTSPSKASQNHCSTLPVCLHSPSGLTKSSSTHPILQLPSLPSLAYKGNLTGQRLHELRLYTLLWKILYRRRDLWTNKPACKFQSYDTSYLSFEI